MKIRVRDTFEVVGEIPDKAVRDRGGFVIMRRGNKERRFDINRFIHEDGTKEFAIGLDDKADAVWFN